MFKNTTNTYGYIARFFHWTMSFLFIVMFLIAYTMINISKSDFRDGLYLIHKATGMLLFSLVAIRLLWRFINVQPPLPKATPIWQNIIAKANIFVLYFIMFTFPISGFLTSSLGGRVVSFYGIFIIQPLANDKAMSELFSKVHEMTAYVLLIAFGMHVIAALYHYYFLRDNVLQRMLAQQRPD